MTKPCEISWVEGTDDVRELARFFSDNVSASYISHSEIQTGRADKPGRWAHDLTETLESEMIERLAEPNGSLKLIQARSDGRLFGLAYVTFVRAARTPFLILEDIVVDRGHRGSGIGQGIVDWLRVAAGSEGIQRFFLESGLDNHKAHHFFEKNGFDQVSIVMMSDFGSQP